MNIEFLHQEIWKEDNDVERNGLLRLIWKKLDQIEKSAEGKIDRLYEQRVFINSGELKYCRNFIKRYEKERKRITDLFPFKEVTRHVKRIPDIHEFSLSYARNENFYTLKSRFKHMLNILYQIKDADDLIRISGIGEKTVEKIKKQG